MGRLTQYFHYINTNGKDSQTGKENNLTYTHITITPQIKKLRQVNLLGKRKIGIHYSIKDPKSKFLL